jgi:hypothetical protein
VPPENKLEMHIPGWGQWLTPVILATQEAEIKRIMVETSQEQIVQRPYLENNSLKGLAQKMAGRVAQVVRAPA